MINAASKSNNQNSHKYAVGSILTPQKNFLDTPGSNQAPTFRPTVPWKMTESAYTSTTVNPESDRFQSPYQTYTSNQAIDFTPTDFRVLSVAGPSRSGEKAHTSDRFFPRKMDKFTPCESKVERSLNQRLERKDSASEVGDDIRRQTLGGIRRGEMQRLRRENEELKRRLSLQKECDCEAPYIQEEVEYLRHHFTLHIQKHHQHPPSKKE